MNAKKETITRAEVSWLGDDFIRDRWVLDAYLEAVKEARHIVKAVREYAREHDTTEYAVKVGIPTEISMRLMESRLAGLQENVRKAYQAYAEACGQYGMETPLLFKYVQELLTNKAK